MVQISNQNVRHVDVVYKIEDMRTGVSFCNWSTSRCQLGKKLTFRQDFEPIFPSRMNMLASLSPKHFSKGTKIRLKRHAPLMSLQEYLNNCILAKGQLQSPNSMNNRSYKPRKFENEIINNNNFSIMFFTQIRVVHEDLNSSEKETKMPSNQSKSFLVSDSLNIYNPEDISLSKIDEMNEFVSKIQNMHGISNLDVLPVPMHGSQHGGMRIKTLNASEKLSNSNDVCEVIVTPDKDIICSQKKKVLDVSVTFFVKGSFKIFIDIFSFPINTFLSSVIYKSFCKQFFTSKLIQKFIAFYSEQKIKRKDLFGAEFKDLLCNLESQKSLPSNYSGQISFKSNMRTYTNNSVYRKDTTKPDTNPPKTGGQEAPPASSTQEDLVWKFLDILYNKIDKKLVLGFLKKNVSKKDICNFLAKNINHVDLKTIQKSCIVAEANDISQASIEIKEIPKDFFEKALNAKSAEGRPIQTNPQSKSIKTPKQGKSSAKIPTGPNTQNQLADFINLGDIKSSKRLDFQAERMNFSKKQFILINNGESKIDFELSLLQSVFQESNLRDETQIDKLDTEIQESRKNFGRGDKSCRSRATRATRCAGATRRTCRTC